MAFIAIHIDSKKLHGRLTDSEVGAEFINPELCLLVLRLQGFKLKFHSIANHLEVVQTAFIKSNPEVVEVETILYGILIGDIIGKFRLLHQNLSDIYFWTSPCAA